MPRIKAYDVAHLNIDFFPNANRPNAEDELKEFEVNIGPKKKPTTRKDFSKLIKEVDKSKTKTKKLIKPITDINLTKKISTTKKPNKSNIPKL